jgi:Spy/CpxP family protein refolding chaperone
MRRAVKRGRVGARDGFAARAAMKEYHTALAAQVRAGKLDAAKLDALQAAADKAVQASKDKDAQVLDGLYAALDPAQRKALVAAVRAKRAEHPAPARPEGAKPSDAERAKKLVEHLTKELDLDAAQQKKVEALVAKAEQPAPDAAREEMKKHADAVLVAFEADGFDAKKLELPAPPAKKSPMALHAQLVAQLLPLLKPEQREKLAAQEEKQVSGHPSPHGAEGGETGMEGEGPADEAPAAP